MIGVDLVEIERFTSIKTELFCQKVFTPAERSYLESKRYAPATLAGMFAAKEAVLKALGFGIGQGIALQDVEILHTPQGAPQARLHRKAAELVKARGELFVSITHTGALALAVAYCCPSVPCGRERAQEDGENRAKSK